MCSFSIVAPPGYRIQMTCSIVQISRSCSFLKVKEFCTFFLKKCLALKFVWRIVTWRTGGFGWSTNRRWSLHFQRQRHCGGISTAALRKHVWLQVDDDCANYNYNDDDNNSKTWLLKLYFSIIERILYVINVLQHWRLNVADRNSHRLRRGSWVVL